MQCGAFGAAVIGPEPQRQSWARRQLLQFSSASQFSIIATALGTLARELAVTSPIATKATSFRKSPAYRLLKAHDLITSPIFIVIKGANEFKDKINYTIVLPSATTARFGPLDRDALSAAPTIPRSLPRVLYIRKHAQGLQWAPFPVAKQV